MYVDDAYACALDAEWDATAAPCAALLQLAFKLSHGGRMVVLLVRALPWKDLVCAYYQAFGPGAERWGVPCCAVQDLQKLPTREAHSFVGDIFRRQELLKVCFASVNGHSAWLVHRCLVAHEDIAEVPSTSSTDCALQIRQYTATRCTNRMARLDMALLATSAR